jgi:crossover junction endodeoxyribonuclease RuvC
MRVLGIDPGSERTGYAVIETDGSDHQAIIHGVITTSNRLPFHKRLLKIHSGLLSVLKHCRADVMAIEEVFYAANVQSALKLGHARGIALLVAGQLNLPVFEYSPLEIKSSIVGYGRAEKHQVQSMVQVLLQLPDKPPPDAADALAVAICHSHHSTSRIPRAPGRRTRRLEVKSHTPAE